MEASEDPANIRELLQKLQKENRPGLVGFVLSLLQLAGHGVWIALVQFTVKTGRAETISSSDPLAWAIVVAMGLSTALTLIALFVCLFYGLRREPRVLPLLGLALAFFTGAFAFFAVLLS